MESQRKPSKLRAAKTNNKLLQNTAKAKGNKQKKAKNPDNE